MITRDELMSLGGRTMATLGQHRGDGLLAVIQRSFSGDVVLWHDKHLPEHQLQQIYAMTKSALTNDGTLPPFTEWGQGSLVDQWVLGIAADSLAQYCDLCRDAEGVPPHPDNRRQVRRHGDPSGSGLGEQA